MHNSKNFCTFATGNVFVIMVKEHHETTSPRRRGVFFCCLFPFLWCKYDKKSKKCKKNQKKCEKICIYQKKAVPLHQISKQGDRKHQKLTPKSY